MTEQRKVRAILADDEMHIRMLMKAVLTSMNIEIIGEAKNGQEAIDLFKKERPHLTFLDVNMPIKDGKSALKDIKKDFPDTCVIMLTSVSSMETVMECLQLGADNYIRKDTPLNEIKKIIKESWEEHTTSLQKAQ